MRHAIFLFFLFSSCTYNEIAPICEPDVQSFSELVYPIIESNCIGCHGNNSGRPAVLTTYENFIDAVNNYALEEWVVSLQMPPDGVGLDHSEIEIITNWIDCE